MARPTMRAGAFPSGFAIALIALAAITRQPAIVVIAAGALVAWLVVEVTGRLALAAVEVTVSAEPDHLVAGEELDVRVVVTNRKPLPLPWLDLTLTLPEGMEPIAGGPPILPEGPPILPEGPPNLPEGPRRQTVGAGFAPRGHERATLVFRLRARERGAHAIGPLRLRAGDWLGFTSDERAVPLDVSVIAYPAPLSVRDRHVASLRPLAETAARRGLIPDPLRFRGVREHRRGDPRKEIHWKASARLGSLQTKVYEPAASLDAIFLVNVASYEQYWVQADPEAVELVISATAELIRMAADAGRQVGLVTNGLDNVTHERPRSALGRGPRPLRRSLEILARLGPYAAASPEAVFLRERGRLPSGATLIVVTPLVARGLADAAVALRHAHHRVLVLSVAPVGEALAARLRAQNVGCDALMAVQAARPA